MTPNQLTSTCYLINMMELAYRKVVARQHYSIGLTDNHAILCLCWTLVFPKLGPSPVTLLQQLPTEFSPILPQLGPRNVDMHQRSILLSSVC